MLMAPFAFAETVSEAVGDDAALLGGTPGGDNEPSTAMWIIPVIVCVVIGLVLVCRSCSGSSCTPAPKQPVPRNVNACDTQCSGYSVGSADWGACMHECLDAQ